MTLADIYAGQVSARVVGFLRPFMEAYGLQYVIPGLLVFVVGWVAFRLVTGVGK